MIVSFFQEPVSDASGSLFTGLLITKQKEKEGRLFWMDEKEWEEVKRSMPTRSISFLLWSFTKCDLH